jgi:uncharacterized protein
MLQQDSLSSSVGLMDFALIHAWLAITASGFLIGFLVGMTGVGAGALTTPLLISGFAVPPAVAVGTDLLFASITKASAAWRHQRLGNVDWHILRALAAGSLPGATGMLAWLYFAKPEVHALAQNIRHTLAFALIASAVSIAAYPWLVHHDASVSTVASGKRRRQIATAALGVVLGMLVTMTSVGAGAIGVVVLTIIYPALMARRLIGTDIVHAIPLTFFAGLGQLGMGNVDFPILAALLVGSVPGIALGSRITGIIPDRLLRLVLAFVLLYAASALLVR